MLPDLKNQKLFIQKGDDTFGEMQHFDKPLVFHSLKN